MKELLKIRVVTPKGSVLDTEAASLTAQGDLGEFCVLPNHRPILSALLPGRMIAETLNGEKIAYAIDRGFLEGGPDHVNAITERCAKKEDLDRSALQKEQADLEQKLEGADPEAPDLEALKDQLSWVRTRLTVAD